MVFDSGCTNFNSHQQCTRVSHTCFFTFSLTFITSYLFENSHSNRYEVVSHCGFDMHFPDG